jgi:CheY-like chemotaxis protein
MDKKVLLLADDDIDDTEMFCEAVANIDKNIVCHCAPDGRQALQMLNELSEKPNIIFLDVNMPVMNGWQCLKLLKEDSRHKQIPVIIVSTSSHQRERDIAGDLGALCYLTKPNDFNELTKVLQMVVANLGDGLLNALQNMQGSFSQFVYCYQAKAKE